MAELFQVRAELYSPARLPPNAYELFLTRALVTDVVAQQCWLYTLAITKLRETVLPEGDGVPRVGIVGGGHMGCSVAMAMLENHYPADSIQISTRQPDRIPKCDALASPSHQTQFQTIARFYDNARLSRESDILILCVPPAQLKSVAIQIKHALSIAHSPCVVISILCGTATETLQKACGTKLVLRTQVQAQQLATRVLDEDRDERLSLGVVSDELTTLRQDAVSLAAAHLARGGESPVTSALGSVLTELARRLDRSLAASRAAETVAALLCDDVTHSDGTPHAAEKTESASRWIAAWTPAIEQLQRHLGAKLEGDILT